MLNRNFFVQLFIGVIFSQLLIANAHAGKEAVGSSIDFVPSGNIEISNRPSSSSNAPLLADCPPGLEPLSLTRGILLREKKNGRASRNHTRIIKNAAGKEIYYAAEEYVTRGFSGKNSVAFNMSIFDRHSVEVLHLMKQKSSSSYLEVSLPGGNIIGKVEKEHTFIHRRLKIMNPNNQVILHINGTSVTLAGGHNKLKVFSLDGKEVGQIKKHHTSILQKVKISSKDDFNDVTFNFFVHLDVRVKATLLGACLFINEYFFQPSTSPSINANDGGVGAWAQIGPAF